MRVLEVARISGSWRGQSHKPAFEAGTVPVSAAADVTELGGSRRSAGAASRGERGPSPAIGAAPRVSPLFG